MYTSNKYREWAIAHRAFIALLVSTSLSILGSLVVIITYALYKDIRSSSRHIIVCISIADLIVSTANLVADILPAGILEVCVLQSFIGSTANLCSFMWTLFLAVFLHITFVQEKPAKARALIHPWFHLLGWLFPLAINVVALCTRNLGDNNDRAVSGWCWIRIPSKFILLMFCSYYLVTFFILFIYLFILFYIFNFQYTLFL